MGTPYPGKVLKKHDVLSLTQVSSTCQILASLSKASLREVPRVVLSPMGAKDKL
jgi:hypothetical protein